MLCLGIDPDLHDLAIASWDDQGPVTAHVVHVPRVKGLVGNDAALAMMAALKDPWPNFCRDDLLPGAFGAMPDAVAVEAQELARGPGAQHRRPQDIVTLGQVAGAALMSVFYRYLHCPAYFPKPSEWKGSVPKAAMQARLYTELGWGYRMMASNSYAMPDHVQVRWEFGSAKWKHLGDALLLARWCWEQASGRKWQPGVR